MNARLKVKYEAEVKIGEVKSMDTGKLMEMARGDQEIKDIYDRVFYQ